MILEKYKRIPIRVKIRFMAIMISVFAVLIISFIGIIAMIRIRNESEFALTKQTINNINVLASNKVQIANIDLERYKDYIDRYARVIGRMYSKPEDFVLKKVEKPNTQISNQFTLQRSYRDKGVDKRSTAYEMALLANMQNYWISLMEKNNDIITSIYLATDKGLMLTYDKDINIKKTDYDGEIYFDYTKRSWYQQAKKSKKLIFTKLEDDYYGRGKIIVCASSFYNNGKFAGVVGMSFSVDNLQNEIINVGINEGVYPFIVDGEFNIVALPDSRVNLIKFDFNALKNYIVEKKDISKSGLISINNDAYFVYTPIKYVDWILCIYIPFDYALDLVYKIDGFILMSIIIFIVSFVILLIFVVFIVRKYANRITFPLIKLKNDVDVISGGNLDKKVEIIGNDEISDLATAFNNMTVSLKKYIEDLTYVTAEKERIGAELNVATNIQASMLPSIFPAFPEIKNFDIYATMNPAKEVGGDFYDFFLIDEKHLAIVVADVSGKGVPASLFMVIGKTLLKDHTLYRNKLDDVFADVNNLLCESNSESLFITAYEMVINIETGHVNYVNAGHELPFIYRKDEGYSVFNTKKGFVLAGMENVKYSIGEFTLNPGDKFFQYTDGVVEAINKDNEMYGMDRLCEVLNKNKELEPQELLMIVKKDIDSFVLDTPQFDDITMVSFYYKGNIS